MVVAHAFNNSFQFEYNFIATSRLINKFVFYSSENQRIKSDYFDSYKNGFGFYYKYQVNIWNDLYFGFRTGLLISDQYLSRFIMGYNIRYYLFQDWILNGECNYGIPLLGKNSDMNPQSTESGGFYSFGFGKNIDKYFSIIIKFNKPFNKLYGSSSSIDDNSKSEYYLNSIYTLSLEYCF